MTDTITNQRLLVSAVATGPYIVLPVSQLEHVREILNRNRIKHRVSEHAISRNGGPETIIIDLGRGVDGMAVQQILDSAR